LILIPAPVSEYKTQLLKGLHFKKTFLGNRLYTLVFT
jgi:hypothetical protein